MKSQRIALMATAVFVLFAGPSVLVQYWGTHGITVDQRGNLYLAEVSNGRAQQFRPKKGADPTKLIGQPHRATTS